jgi:hypothetical protein
MPSFISEQRDKIEEPFLTECSLCKDCIPTDTCKVYSGMLRRVDLVRFDVSEGRSASIIRVTSIVFPRTVHRLLVMAKFVLRSQILVTLITEAVSSPEMSVLTKAHRVTSQKTAFFIVTAVKP